MQKIPDFPLNVVIEPTNACNLMCKMCPRNYMQDPIGDIDLNFYKRLIDEMEKYKASLTLFWRGEPLMHKKIQIIMTYAKRRIKHVSFGTNGVLGPSSGAGPIYVDFLSIGCHNMHGVNYAKQVWQAKQNYRSSLPVVQVSAVEGEAMANDLKYLIGDKADRIRIYKRHSRGGEFGAVDGGLPKSAKRKYCERLNSTMVIDYKGDVSRCCYQWDTDPEMSVVNSSIRDVWQGSRLRKIREDYPDRLCQKCDQWAGTTVGSVELIGEKEEE